CVSRVSYDPVGNLVRVTNPTAVVPAQAGRFTEHRYSDDNLLLAVEAPNPAAGAGGDVEARIETMRYGYDASGRRILEAAATGRRTDPGDPEERWLTETTLSADGLPLVVEQRALSDSGAQRRVATTY